MSQHIVDGTLVNVAGISFILCFILGLSIGAKFDKATLWPSIVIGLLCCVVRALSEPLGIMAIAAVSILHINIACLTVLILRNTTPLKGSKTSGE